MMRDILIAWEYLGTPEGKKVEANVKLWVK